MEMARISIWAMNIQTNGLGGWNIREMAFYLAYTSRNPAETSRFPTSHRDSFEAFNEILSGLAPSAKYFWLQIFMNFSLPCSRRTRNFPFVGKREGNKESQHRRRCDRWKREEWIPSTARNWRFPICLSTVAVSLPILLWRRSENVFHWLIHLRAGALRLFWDEIMLSVVLDASP